MNTLKILKTVNKDDFEMIYEFQLNYGDYYAFSKDIPDEVIEKLQADLDEIKKEEIYKTIVNKYPVE